MRYSVLVPEVWHQRVDVDAETIEEAIKLVQGGGGDYIEDVFTYSHTLEDGEWEVRWGVGG